MGVKKACAELQKLGRYMMDHSLAWGNAGNISMRTGNDQYLITASGTDLGELSDHDFVECSFLEGGLTDDLRKPSKEMPMHRAIYEERPEINVVLHSSPFYSTLIACSTCQVPSNLFVETIYYLENVDRVAYHHPGSEELGDAVRSKAMGANILLLENHGVLVYDTSIREARMALQTLEMACRMFISAQNSGVVLSYLTPPIMEDFLNNSGYKPRRGKKS